MDHFLRVGVRLMRIGRSPWSLLLILVFVNSCFQPYRGLSHDARLYAFEVMNHLEDGRFHDELSLCYDRAGNFSVFSSLVLPVAQWTGIEVAFFLVYLVCKVFMIFALQRLVLALVRERKVAVAALLVMVAAPIDFGGMGVFHVNESFLTPRILAIGLVLLGLERLLLDRWIVSILLLMIALLIHPIMAVAGLLTWTCFVLSRCLSTRQFAGVLGVTSFAAVVCLAVPMIGLRLFGEMDPLWKERVVDFNHYSIPTKWRLRDWVHIGIAFLTAIVASLSLTSGDQRRRLLLSMASVSAIGIVGSLIATRLPYALLFQGQPYRALWLVQLFQIPLALHVASLAWSRRYPLSGIFAFAVASFVLSTSFGIWSQYLLFFGVVCLAYVIQGVALTRWLIATIGVSVIAMVNLMCLSGALGRMKKQIGPVVQHLEFYFLPRYVTHAAGSFLCILSAVTIVVLLSRRISSPVRRGMAIAAASIALQVTMFVAPSSPWVTQFGFAESHNVRLASEYLRDHPVDKDLPTVHWTNGDSAIVWFKLRAKSFFSPAQLAGNMFLRSSAMEGRRRALLTAPFDLHEMNRRPHRLPGYVKQIMQQVYQRPLTCRPPGEDDLIRLCQESDVDLLITYVPIGDCYAATNGITFVYDLRKLRQERQILSSQHVACDRLTSYSTNVEQ